MAEKPGFFDYITAAFNARPFGMFVAPNWIGLGAFGLLGMVEPGFWVVGAGLELDTSAHDVYVTRTRLLVRYKVGNNVTGWALGLGLSF